MSDEKTTMTCRVEKSLRAAYDRATKANDRTGAQLLRDFMRDFVRQQQEAAEHDVWLRRQVQMGLDSANAGELLSGEEVEAEAAAWRAEMRRKLDNAAS